VSDEDFNHQARLSAFEILQKHVSSIQRRPPHGIAMICGWDQDFPAVLVFGSLVLECRATCQFWFDAL
jgi:hypothetical protein